MDEDDVIPGSIIPGGEVRGDFENFANTVKILEYLAAGFNPLGPSGTANQEFKTVKAYLQNIYGPLPEGADDYATSDLNGNGTNEVYAVDANGKPHTIYSYENNEVVSTSYEDFQAANTSGGMLTGDDTTAGDDSTDPSQISDEEAISAVLASVPEKLKGVFTEDNIIKVLETVLEEPMTKIKTP